MKLYPDSDIIIFNAMPNNTRSLRGFTLTKMLGFKGLDLKNPE